MSTLTLSRDCWTIHSNSALCAQLSCLIKQILWSFSIWFLQVAMVGNTLLFPTWQLFYRVNDMVGWIKMLLRCSPCNKRKKEMDNKNKWINKYNLLLMCIVHKCHSWNLVGKKNATLRVVIVFGHSLIKVFGHSLIQVYVGHSLIKVYACSLFN